MARENKKKLVLIDGSSYIYRAYHALPKLSNSKGEPTGAVFGFAQMIKKVLRDLGADKVAVVYDPPGGSFRNEMYPEYKAHREAMPEDLVEQLPRIRRLIELWRIPTVEVPGYEADDVIGAIANKAKDDYEVLIVTSDKDMGQIVDKNVRLLDTMKDRLTGPDEIKEKYGVGPEKLVEILGLAGDPSDNVPGVPGIGEKTARQLIEKYGSIEEVLAHIDEIPGRKRKENLRKYADQALLSRKLVTLAPELPLEVDPDDLDPGEPDSAGLREMLAELEFHSLMDAFEPAEGAKKAPPAGRYFTITTRGEFKNLVESMKKAEWISFDTETDSLSPMRARLVGISFSVKENEAYYIPLAHEYLGAPEQLDTGEVLETLEPILKNPSAKLVAQNAKYDMLVLARHGLNLEKNIAFDTMVAGYVLNPSRYRQSLEVLAHEYLARSVSTYSDLVGKGARARPYREIDVKLAADYSCEDAEVAFALRPVLEKKLREQDLWEIFDELEMPLVPVLMRMEKNGVLIDPEKMKKISEEIDEQLKELLERLHELAGAKFNPNSPKQLAEVLFDDLGLPVIRKTKTGRSTDQEVLEELALLHELPSLVLEYRSMSKIKGTYADSLPKLINPETGRIHTSFNQTVTNTGRLSSSDPNLQNIPVRSGIGRRIREAFVPGDGRLLVSADYNQIELRILAHITGDETLLDSFRRGEDIHTRTAAELFGVPAGKVTPDQRRMAKVVNFGIAYGMSPYGLAKNLRIPRDEAKKIHDAYFERYPKVKEYMERKIEDVRKTGYVKTLRGRKINLPDINSRNRTVRANAERAAINAPLQGTAADIIKEAMVRVQKFLDDNHPETKMILQVHDELLFEAPEPDVPEIEKAVKHIMESVMEIEVPLPVDIGHGSNWGEAH